MRTRTSMPKTSLQSISAIPRTAKGRHRTQPRMSDADSGLHVVFFPRERSAKKISATVTSGKNDRHSISVSNCSPHPTPLSQSSIRNVLWLPGRQVACRFARFPWGYAYEGMSRRTTVRQGIQKRDELDRQSRDVLRSVVQGKVQWGIRPPRQPRLRPSSSVA